MGKTNDEKRYCVYMHRFPNRKVYIGQTCKKPENRWGKNGKGYLLKNQDGSYKQSLIANAINKYGWKDVEHIILFDNLDENDVDRIEQICILLFRANDRKYGYNIENGGTKQKELSEETKKKISESKIGEKNPMYGVHLTGEKNGMYGKKLSKEHKQKLLQAAKKANSGKIMSEEAKNKISKAKKGKYVGENSPFYGRHHTEEAKKKMSESHKRIKACNAKSIVQMDDEYNVIKIWTTIADAYKTLNICRQSIPEVLNKKQQHAGNFRWFYLYDQTKKDGTVIKGAITLGYITKEEAA